MELDTAKNDLVNTLSRLEAHWQILEAELVEINSDLKHLDTCTLKYGEHFQSSILYLKDLKTQKKNKMKEILRTMEAFNKNLTNSRRLVKLLEKDCPIDQS
ncbi:hypothetical protein PCE1_003381 [Barthelona sp. PCE]